MMTRKDFQAVADKMKASKPVDTMQDNSDPHYLPAIIQWKTDVLSIGQAMREINPRFDGEKFREACGYYE